MEIDSFKMIRLFDFQNASIFWIWVHPCGRGERLGIFLQYAFLTSSLKEMNFTWNNVHQFKNLKTPENRNLYFSGNSNHYLPILCLYELGNIRTTKFHLLRWCAYFNNEKSNHLFGNKPLDLNIFDFGQWIYFKKKISPEAAMKEGFPLY